jgi:uncharacterized membrane protein YgcG
VTLRRLFLVLVLLGLAAPARAQKELSWDEIAVSARLDAEGRLHVTERQAMRFNGDWNGGERIFRLRSDQELELESIARVDPDLRATFPMEKGDLSSVDHYKWVTPTTLRWRSRRASDPPFQDQRIDYVLKFTYDNILQPADGGYVLDHDFSFADRVGGIRVYRLDLVLDPVWRAAEVVPTGVVVKGMLPGEGYVVKLNLTYLGAGRPAGVITTGPTVRLAARGLLVLVPLLLFAQLLVSQRKAGRLRPLPEVGRAWFEEQVAAERPEVIGAVWDAAVGAPEVAAVLARLTAEGKMRSRVVPGSWGKSDLELTLLVPRESFDGYESRLVEALFVDGDTTSTSRLKKHYKKSGFDPSKKIQGPLEEIVRERYPIDPAPLPSKRPTLLLFLAAGLLIAASRPVSNDVPFYVLPALGLVFALPLTLFPAYHWRQSLQRGVPGTALFMVPVLAVIGGALAFTLIPGWGRHSLGMLGLACAVLGYVRMVMNFARTRLGPRALEHRRRLTAARLWVKRQLATPRPDLDDAWFPYVVAFGLDKAVQGWFQSFGGPSSRSGSSDWGGVSSRSTSSSTASPSPSGWTGGGGSFGGAGASAAWGAAAVGMASGVASPSSGSSSGSSGGGGSSSSGGGGGGGW